MKRTEDTAACQAPACASQTAHRSAADMHEKAAKHYRHAALLQDKGDREQAQTHINIARRHAIAASLWTSTAPP